MSLPNTSVHTSLDLFQVPTVLSSHASFLPVETLSQSNDNGQTLDFVLSTDRNLYLDLSSIELKVGVTIVKEGGSKKLEAADDISLVNNALHSLFSNCAVYLNNELIIIEVNSAI